MPRQKPPATARLAAGLALVDFALALITLIALLINDAPYLLGALVCVMLGVPVAWAAATSRRARLPLWSLAVALLCGGLTLLFIANRSIVWLLTLLVEIGVMAWFGGRAVRWEVAAVIARRWTPVPPAERAVLFMNPKSGGGTVERLHLVEECRRRGIEPVVLSEHADLRQLAEDAVARGADVIGMAGGDGSQAIVASVAAEHGIAYVCVPAGTRNHLALDLGVNRRDVVGSLDAFGAARQAWMDLARVNNHVFVNNASLGVYAEIVSSDAYRDAKIRTVSSMLPDLLGPDATPFDLKIEGPDGRPIDGVHLVLVSNGPYVLDRLGALGTRPRLNAGCLGIAALRLDGPADVAAFIALEAAGRVDNFEGWTAWTAPTVVIGAGAPVAAGVDGESRQFDPPLEFAIWPGALRVRTAIHHPGVSPAATRHGVGRSTFSGLARIVLGYPSGLIDEPSGQQGAPGRPATGSSVRKSC